MAFRAVCFFVVIKKCSFFGAVTWGPLFFGVKSMGAWGEISSIEIPLNEPSAGETREIDCGGFVSSCLSRVWFWCVVTLFF